jgi:hypothetical protein
MSFPLLLALDAFARACEARDHHRLPAALMVKLTAASGLVREHGGPASDPEDDMGKLIAFEWMSLNGVFDADTMNERTVTDRAVRVSQRHQGHPANL